MERNSTLFLAAAIAALLVPQPPLRSAPPVPATVPAHPSEAGEQPAAKPVTLTSLIASLRSEHFRERADAMTTLMRWPAERRSAIEDALAREADPEAALRLTRVAVHLFLKARTSLTGPGSLLGITLMIESLARDPDAQDAHSAVVVTGIQLGFPAAEFLQEGDRIIAIDDDPFPDHFEFNDFRNLISQRQAGTVVQMTLLRGGKPMKVGVQLAGLSAEDMEATADFVNRRLRLSEDYIRTLKTALPNTPLIN